MKADQIARHMATKIRVARQMIRGNSLQAAVTMLAAVERDAKEAIWLLERRIAHEGHHDCKRALPLMRTEP
jgi:hypothetical protein